MRAVLLTVLMLFSQLSSAADWAYTKDKAFHYDKDSIVREGFINGAVVGGIGWAKFNCVEKEVFFFESPTARRLGWIPIPDPSPLNVLITAVCSKPWEFWKR